MNNNFEIVESGIEAQMRLVKHTEMSRKKLHTLRDETNKDELLKELKKIVL